MPNGVNRESTGQKIAEWIIPLAAVAFAVIVALVLYFEGVGTAMDRLKVVTGYLILILVFFYGLMVLINMATGKIDLSDLLSEADGKSSMSRFQLLIFTFVVALSLFLIIVASPPPKFPEIPTAILTLLGISATTYAAGKALHPASPSEGSATTQQETTHVERTTTQNS